ncbi:hypothetical protein [Ekhidna sp.]
MIEIKPFQDGFMIMRIPCGIKANYLHMKMSGEYPRIAVFGNTTAMVTLPIR